MPDSLYWSSVTPLLKDVLTRLMEAEVFRPFRLVGGTSLSLQLGHRISVDIDLFTDAEYRSIDFNEVYNFLKRSFPYVSDPYGGDVGMGTSYRVGYDEHDPVKLDLFYTDSFIQPALTVGPYRLATVEEIAAMKIDVVQRGGRKKDFWDLHEILHKYPVSRVISLHRERYPYGHDEETIRANFVDFTKADGDFDPICMQGKYWELIKLDIVQSLQSDLE